MSEINREGAVAHIREQVSRIREQYAHGDQTFLIPAAVRLTVLADEIESPDAPAWILDMLQRTGTPAPRAGA
ncbi:hypothetical protein [Acidithiobacillus ferriphilus]|uniref:hypothetical protein n=1 Tax=Acidithiobacillus ferriphilus TaxID=1689834 RepID=UPI001C07C162|nr:hypothetical protein [Acidithiobacillus ferriphilus]MBU2831904.1 hypothetical protein [Acidithiobacillus ferriphilus]